MAGVVTPCWLWLCSHVCISPITLAPGSRFSLWRPQNRGFPQLPGDRPLQHFLFSRSSAPPYLANLRNTFQVRDSGEIIDQSFKNQSLVLVNVALVQLMTIGHRNGRRDWEVEDLQDLQETENCCE